MSNVFEWTFYNAVRAPRFEPQKRRHDGATSVCGHVAHRFPIKGGITLAEIMRQSALRPTRLFNLGHREDHERLIDLTELSPENVGGTEGGIDRNPNPIWKNRDG